MSSLATHVNQTKANKEWKSSHNPTNRERRIEEDRERMTEEKQRNGGGGGGGGGSFFRSSSEERKSSATSAAAADKKVIIKSADMKEDMQSEAIDCAISAFEKHDVEKDIAEYIKKVFDKKHGPTWHCIVGRNFGSYVTHETNHFVYFYLGQKAILLFKSG